jgi:hypothetical protein
MLYETKFLVSLILTLLIETLILLAILKIIAPKIKNIRIILSSILATSLTLPYLWFIFPKYLTYPTYIIIGEIFVFLIEAIIYWRTLPITLKKALFISFIANFLSLVFGLIFFN